MLNVQQIRNEALGPDKKKKDGTHHTAPLQDSHDDYGCIAERKNVPLKLGYFIIVDQGASFLKIPSNSAIAASVTLLLRRSNIVRPNARTMHTRLICDAVHPCAPAMYQTTAQQHTRCGHVSVK